MPRPGRKLLPGPRQPDGRHKPDNDPPDAVARWKRARALAEAKVIDPCWGSAVAQLAFFKRLSDREACAADRWAEWAGRYDRLKGYQSRSCASPQYEIGYGRGDGGAVELRAGDREFMDKFDAARKAVIATCGLMGVSILDDTAVLNQSVGSTYRLERMKAALAGLLQHWKM